MTNGLAPRVIVGVADTPEGRAAVQVGADIAETFSLPLHLVRVWRDVDWFLSAPISAMTVLQRSNQYSCDLLDAATRAAREFAPSVPVTAEVERGSIYAVLLDLSVGAHTLVLGSEHDEHPGPIAQWYLEHACCPVLIVDAAGEAVAGTLHGATAPKAEHRTSR